MERRIVTQLMTCMDEYHRLVQPANANSDPESSDEKPGNVLVIGATNRPDAIDPALRRPGRFDREIRLGVPDENARVEILSVLTRKCTLEGSLDLLQIARSTPGFVGADLDALVDKAGNLAMRRILSHRKSELTGEYSDREYTEEWWKMPWLPEEIEKLAITMSDFEVIFSYIMCLCCTCACVNMDASPFFFLVGGLGDALVRTIILLLIFLLCNLLDVFVNVLAFRLRWSLTGPKLYQIEILLPGPKHGPI